MADTPSGQLPAADLQVVAVDPHIYKRSPSLIGIREAAAWLMGGKIHETGIILGELLKSGGEVDPQVVYGLEFRMVIWYNFYLLEEVVGRPYLEGESGPTGLP